VILKESRIAGNIGAIARVMKNFGFSRLILINPQVELLSSESIARAKHAVDVLSGAEVHSSLKNIGPFDFLIGTSAHIGGDYNTLRVGITIDELIKNMQDIEGEIGLLFGPEDSGLTNEDLSACDFLVSIPSSPEYRTLNISHAACIILYEIYKVKQARGPDQMLFRKASRVELDQLLAKYEGILDYLHDHMKKFDERRRADASRVFHNIVGRSFISGREAHTMMGVFRHVLENLQGIWKDRT